MRVQAEGRRPSAHRPSAGAPPWHRRRQRAGRTGHRPPGVEVGVPREGAAPEALVAPATHPGEPVPDLEHRMLAVAAALRQRIGGPAVPVEAVVWRRPASGVAAAPWAPVMDPRPGIPVMAPDIADADAAREPEPLAAEADKGGAALAATAIGELPVATPVAARSAAIAEVATAGTSAAVETASSVRAMVAARLAASGTAPAPRKPPVIESLHDLVVDRVRSTPAQRIGDEGERLAALRLEALGWRIVARNVRLGRAEVDVLAIDPSPPPTLVVVEVRSRSRRDFGLPEETVDHRKRALLQRAAAELEARPVLPDGTRLPGLPVRIDLIAIDRGPGGSPSIRHHRGIEG